MGRVLRKYRDIAGLTQIELSELTRLGKRTCSKIETGSDKSTLETIERISTKLHLVPIYLVDRINKPTNADYQKLYDYYTNHSRQAKN